jgi:ABC-type uncharacterized transport system permease subunit
MMTIICGLIAVLLYTSSAWLQRQHLVSPALTANSRGSNVVLGLAVMALIAHFCNAISVINTAQGYDFGFFKVASLFSWVMAVIIVLSSLKKPVANLFLALFPLAILCILCSSFLPSNYNPNPTLSSGVALHSGLGIIAFSLLTIAAIQALLVAWLSKELKQHHFSTTLRHLPPLQTLEELLFQTIQAGFFALLAVILSGFIFMDDMFAQHLVHKTALTMVSWLVFGILLWGRHQRGWRGKTALRWILAGFSVLILAYFGSKFVLEIVLDRV